MDVRGKMPLFESVNKIIKRRTKVRANPQRLHAAQARRSRRARLLKERVKDTELGDFSVRTQRCLIDHGITTLAQLKRLTAAQLAQLACSTPGFGPKSLREVVEFIETVPH